MKVKDLIKYLDGVNPEAEVVVNGRAVLYNGVMPGFYDGAYTEALMTEDDEVLGIKWTRQGYKFVLSLIDGEDSLFENPKFKIEWDESDPYFSQEQINKTRLRHKAIGWEGLKLNIKYRNISKWFPLDAYDYADNPYDEYLPEEYR